VSGFRTRHWRKRLADRLVAIGAIAAMGALGFSQSASSAEVYSEDAVKAAFIYRFAGYVDWPRETGPVQAFTIAVMGSKEIEARLQSLTAGRTLHGRPVAVRRVSRVQEAADAQILYIGPKHLVQLKHLVQAVGGRRLLVVTDEPSGLDSGSSINLLMVDQRVRFEVSTEAARRAGLNISSGLLSVAVRVQGDRVPGELVAE